MKKLFKVTVNRDSSLAKETKMKAETTVTDNPAESIPAINAAITDWKKFFQDYLEKAAYQPEYMTPAMKEFLELLAEATTGGDFADFPENWSDFMVTKYEIYVATLISIPKTLIREIEERISFCKQHPDYNLKPWELPVSDKRREAFLKNKLAYTKSNIMVLKYRAHELERRIIEGFSPKDVLLTIVEYWELLWNYQSTYEAAEYCVILTDFFWMDKVMWKKFRNYFKKNA